MEHIMQTEAKAKGLKEQKRRPASFLEKEVSFQEIRYKRKNGAEGPVQENVVERGQEFFPCVKQSVFKHPLDKKGLWS